MSAGSARDAAVRALSQGRASQAFHGAFAGRGAAHLAGTGALHVAAGIVVAVDEAGVAGPYTAAIHVVAIEVATLAADGAAGHGVVAAHVTVVAAARTALLHVEALRAALVVADRSAVLQLMAARGAAAARATDVALVPAKTFTGLARIAGVVIATTAEGHAEQQSEHASREQAPHGADYAHIWNWCHKRKRAVLASGGARSIPAQGVALGVA